MNSPIIDAVNARLDREGPHLAIAYVLLILLGWAGGHRWYLGRGGTAVLLFLLMFTGVGFIWWFVDIFLLPGLVERRRHEVRQDALLEALAWSALTRAGPA